MEDIAVKIAELVGTLDDEEADELSMKSGGGGGGQLAVPGVRPATPLGRRHRNMVAPAARTLWRPEFAWDTSINPTYAITEGATVHKEPGPNRDQSHEIHATHDMK